MNYSLLRESRVVIHYDGRAYEFDALSNVSTNLDYQEYKVTRKTLHRKRNYSLSKVVAKNTSSISLAVNLTDNTLEKLFFDLLGFENYNGLYVLPMVPASLEPIYFDTYIITPSSILQIKNCFATAVDFTLEKAIPLLNIAAEGADCTPVTTYPTFGSIFQGNILDYSPLRVNVNNNEMPSVIGMGASFQQQCTWREQRTIHTIGTMYTNKKAYITDMNASASINFNYVNFSNSDTLINTEPEYAVPVRIFNSHLAINFPHSRITKRLSVTDVYSISYDVIPMESGTEPVTIQFFGEK